MHFSRTVLLILLAGTSWSIQAAEITVSAAASLKDAFSEIAKDYQKKYPNSSIKLNTAASGTLLQQLLQGAPVDVLATADEATMNKAIEQKAIDAASRKTFVRNTLALVQPKDSKMRVKNLQDLTQEKIDRIAMGNPASVPAGNYAKAALEKQGLFASIHPKLVYSQNVRQALDYVTRGEVDAGFVYRTDAILQADKLNIVATVPTTTPVSYPIGIVSNSKHQAEAKRFVDYILSAQGQTVLKKYGFSKP